MTYLNLGGVKTQPTYRHQDTQSSGHLNDQITAEFILQIFVLLIIVTNLVLILFLHYNHYAMVTLIDIMTTL